MWECGFWRRDNPMYMLTVTEYMSIYYIIYIYAYLHL